MSFKIACLQMLVTPNKHENLQKALSLLQAASKNKTDLAILPECFNSSYETHQFALNSEHIPEGLTSSMLSKAAKDLSMIIVGGSIPEIFENKLYNTCSVWSSKGSLLGIHRKIHLFDIEIPGKIKFKESDVLTPGNKITLIQTDVGMISIGICYDMRFPELAHIAARRGAVLMVYPGAFNMTTGPLHWDLLQRSRALDNQMYVATCSPARGTHGYIAYGHSSITDPHGSRVAGLDEKEGIVYADMSGAYMDQCRREIPVSFQRRFDVYPDVSSQPK